MRYAGYLPTDVPEEVHAEDPFHQLLERASHLTNEQLIVLIDHAWEEYRSRVGFDLESPRVRPPTHDAG